MAQVPTDDQKLKDLVKAAIQEVLEERKDILREAVEAALEDIALARAIAEGQQTGEVSREQVQAILEGGQ